MTPPTKRELAAKLRRYDKLRHELRALEAELNRDCANYGRSVGSWGFTKDMLRNELHRDRAA